MRALVSHAFLLLLFAGALAPAPASARQSIWPDVGENLQVLPADFSGQRIRAVMRGFSSALGVRCSHCHVGPEGGPLTAYDFASDANPNKDRARAMYGLLGTVNDELDAIELRDAERVNMWCHTCHAGKPRPQVLGEAVGEVYEVEGGSAALAYFLELRDEHYGGAAYDFRPSSVNQLASGFLQEGDSATARAFFRLNVQHFPDFAEGWESLGDMARAAGHREEALRLYTRALELAPAHPRIQASLDALRGG